MNKLIAIALILGVLAAVASYQIVSSMWMYRPVTYLSNAFLIYGSLALVLLLLWFDRVLLSSFFAMAIIVSPALVTFIVSGTLADVGSYTLQEVLVLIVLIVCSLVCHQALRFAIKALKAE